MGGCSRHCSRSNSQDGVDAFLRRVSASQGEVTPMEATCIRGDGDERSIEMTAVNMVGSPEVGGIVVSLVDRTELRRAIQNERRRADFDALTGLLNRRAFEDRARELFKDGVADPAFVAVFDIDNLKQFNDTLGHQLGDVGDSVGCRALVSGHRSRRRRCAHGW